MNLVLFGPPGAGKGTQASIICQRYFLVHLSTGEAIRAEISKGSDLGQHVQATVAAGDLIDDEMVTNIVDEFIRSHRSESDSYLFDGYPRTTQQVHDLDMVLEKHRLTIPAVVNVDVPDDVLKQRITGRRVCPSCGRAYNVLTLPDGDKTHCPDCGIDLVRRKDDSPEAVEERLRVYHEQTEPVLTLYEQRGLLSTVDGGGTPEEVFERISNLLQEAY